MVHIIYIQIRAGFLFSKLYFIICCAPISTFAIIQQYLSLTKNSKPQMTPVFIPLSQLTS